MIVVGCGTDETGGSVTTYPTKGKVLLPDGQPLGQGLVTIVPAKDQGRQATGFIEPDGTYAMGTLKAEGDGVAPGEYLVRINTALDEGGRVPDGAEAAPQIRR